MSKRSGGNDMDSQPFDLLELTCQRLYKYASDEDAAWPLNGREIADMIRACISTGNADFVRAETVRVLRELKERGILAETSFETDWYRPGPNFTTRK
ncbi:hypothetical protein HYW17_00055 [Candidatus Uhrbacteria bacterium]|nr:hypothetical protein [Candidatus Uhrbacteria bacterium]